MIIFCLSVCLSVLEAPTSIALQLESGERLQHDFLPNSSLWDVLTHWDKQKDGLVVLTLGGEHTGHDSVQKINTRARRSTTHLCLYEAGGE